MAPKSDRSIAVVAPGRVKPMKEATVQMPRFKSESEEANWWASPAGRAYVKLKSAESQRKGAAPAGSRLVAELNEKKERSDCDPPPGT
jgi:hypothetical protein